MANEKVYSTKHQIHLTVKAGVAANKIAGTAAKAPTVKVIEAKRRVSLDPESDTTKELLRAGAIELAPAEEANQGIERIDQSAAPKTAPAKKAPAAKKPAAKKAPAAKAGEGEASEKDMI